MNRTISVMKALAIIAMVAGHAELPGLLSNFIYIWHMPLFFMAAGYFFGDRHLADPWNFCTRRVKGLYIPFLKWSIIFLLLHNLWFDIGILNEEYGNWECGVTHPYTLRDFWRRVWLCVTSMSGYDEFLTGAFWFFRGLLVASILFVVFAKALEGVSVRGRQLQLWHIGAIICTGALLFNAFRLGMGFRIPVIPNGGLREIWGLFFFGMGVVYRRFEDAIGNRWWLTLICFTLLCMGAWFHTCGMNNKGQLIDVLTLPLTGLSGWVVMRHLATFITAGQSAFARMMLFVGNNTLYIFIFHIISFKLVNPLKIWWYSLDPAQMGCHMVIHYNNHEDLFWILYTIVGVSVPLIVLQLYRQAKGRGIPTLAKAFRR